MHKAKKLCLPFFKSFPPALSVCSYPIKQMIHFLAEYSQEQLFVLTNKKSNGGVS
jgi:hypothetical protein